MTEQDNTRSSQHYFVYGILAAIILIAVGMLIERDSQPGGSVSFVGSLLKQGGAALLTAGAIGLLFDYIASKDLIWRATGNLKKSITKATEAQQKLLDELEKRVDRVGEEIVMTSGMLRNASTVGIQAVYNGREPSFHQDVARAIRESKDTVRILGISLADLCGWWGGKSEPHEAVDAVMKAPNLKVQVLFSNPEGEGLRTRAKFEHPGIDYEDTRAYKQTLNQIVSTITSAEAHLKNSVEIGLYDDTPTCFLVLTDDLAFIEQYTYASRGGVNVLFAVKSNTPLYRLHADHFEALWRANRDAVAFCINRNLLPRAKGEQGGAGQPATRSELDSEGSDKPQPESEGRSR